jgi:hypothetical protein
METGTDVSKLLKVPKATWISDGFHWPGTWSSAEPDSRGDHVAGIIQVTSSALSISWCGVLCVLLFCFIVYYIIIFWWSIIIAKYIIR